MNGIQKKFLWSYKLNEIKLIEAKKNFQNFDLRFFSGNGQSIDTTNCRVIFLFVQGTFFSERCQYNPFLLKSIFSLSCQDLSNANHVTWIGFKLVWHYLDTLETLACLQTSSLTHQLMASFILFSHKMSFWIM